MIYTGNTASGTPVETLTTVASGGNWSVVASGALGEGTYTAQAEQSDAAGNTGLSNASTVTIDTMPPVLTLTAPVDGSASTNATPLFSGLAGTAAGDSATITVRVYAGGTVTSTPIQALTATVSHGTYFVAAAPALAEGTYTVQAQQSDAAGNIGLSNANTFVIQTPDHLAFLVPPSSSLAGNVITPAVQVEVLDSLGSVVTADNSDTVTLTIASGPAEFSGGSVTATVSGGVATFDNLVLTTAGSYTLDASVSGLTGATSGPFTVNAAPADHLAFSVAPDHGVAGQPLNPSLQVQVLDQYGNLLAGDSSATVTLTVAAGPGQFTSGSVTTAPVSGGVATFANLVLTIPGSGYVLQATSGTLPAVTASAFTVVPGAATHLVLTIPPPASVPAGSAFGVTVAAEDSVGNVDTSFHGSVTLTLSGATVTTTAVNGVASFAGLILNSPGAYTLQASSGSLTAATTNPVRVTANVAPPLLQTARPIAAHLAIVKVGKRKKLVILVTYADTGAKKSQIISPFQKSKYKAIKVTVRDSNGDGVADQVVLTAKKGKKTATRTFAG
jgi:hypothetical protein